MGICSPDQILGRTALLSRGPLETEIPGRRSPVDKQRSWKTVDMRDETCYIARNTIMVTMVTYNNILQYKIYAGDIFNDFPE